MIVWASAYVRILAPRYMCHNINQKTYKNWPCLLTIVGRTMAKILRPTIDFQCEVVLHVAAADTLHMSASLPKLFKCMYSKFITSANKIILQIPLHFKTRVPAVINTGKLAVLT